MSIFTCIVIRLFYGSLLVGVFETSLLEKNIVIIIKNYQTKTREIVIITGNIGQLYCGKERILLRHIRR
jgi:hypothetical protein